VEQQKSFAVRGYFFFIVGEELIDLCEQRFSAAEREVPHIMLRTKRSQLLML
jgi:hypothetical protein